jgi:uncharacterized protein (DUF58 family)
MRELEIVTARLVRAGFAGQYHSAIHGRGVEFSQVREYQPGDDIRTIDWNVTARSGVPHVKEFVEERDLSILLALDVSGSMSFGSVDRRKIDLAVEIASVLAFSALENGDRVGLALVGDGVSRMIPPRRGRVHTQAVIRTALGASRAAGGRSDLEKAVGFMARALRKRTVVVLLSDFLGGDGYSRALRRLAARHDVIAIRIADPREAHFPRAGIVTLVDAESGAARTIDLRSGEPARAAAAMRRASDDALESSGVDFVDVSTAVPYERALVRFFEKRSGRKR